MYNLYGILGISLIVLLIGSIISIGGLIYAMEVKLPYRKKLRYEVYPDTAKVIKKEHVTPYTNTYIIAIGKIMVPQTIYYSEAFNVFLTYDGKEYCFNDEELYNLLEVGDSIYVMVHKGFNKKNEVKDIYLGK